MTRLHCQFRSLLVIEAVDFNTNLWVFLQWFYQRHKDKAVLVIPETATAERVLGGVSVPRGEEKSKAQALRIIVHTNSGLILFTSMCKLKHSVKHFQELKAELGFGFGVVGGFCCTCEFWMCASPHLLHWNYSCFQTGQKVLSGGSCFSCRELFQY